MFYKQFLEITEVLNADFVENFDYWLATLPRNRQKILLLQWLLRNLKFSILLRNLY